jgi:hypothetical protein
VWSLACVVYELLTNSFLFKPKDRKGIGKDEDHLYMMVELLGQFPKSFALDGKHSKSYFNKKGIYSIIQVNCFMVCPRKPSPLRSCCRRTINIQRSSPITLSNSLDLCSNMSLRKESVL